MVRQSQRSRLKSFGIAVSASAAVVGLIVGILAAARVLGGSLEDYAAFAAVAAAVLIVVYLIARRPRSDESERSLPTAVLNGPVVIPPDVQRTTRKIDLDRGDVVFGTIVEKQGLTFKLDLRTPTEQRKANAGSVSVSIGDFTGVGTSSFQSQIPAPTTGTYYVDFQQLGDLSGRQVQTDLRRKPAQ